MFRIVNRVAVLIAIFVLTACGGSGGGSDSSPGNDPLPSGSGSEVTPAAPGNIGIITDSPIANIQYRTASGYEDVTSQNGEFLYDDTDSITFVIGTLEFANVVAKPVVTPFDLFDVKDTADQRLINFLRLVQSLDDDGDISRSITITESAQIAVSSVNLELEDFDVSPVDFDSSEKISSLITELNIDGLVSGEEAVEHFLSTLRDSETIDIDGDGIANRSDEDDDNDGIPDLVDGHPYDGEVGGDIDGDGVDSLVDTDDDNDGVEDAKDAFPFDAEEWADSDGDLIGDNRDSDDDNDGVADDFDRFPLDSSESSDFDDDLIGDNADTDDDNDGVLDESDQYPFNAAESRDFDGDLIGDNADSDDDNDGIPDSVDRLNLVGYKSEYLQEEVIELTAEGLDLNFKIGDSSDGWHIQFYTYDLADPSRYLTEFTAAGAYNGQFDQATATWSIKYWSPRKPGEYKTVISFYCATLSGTCDGQSPDSYQQEFTFTSTCKLESCTYELDQPRGNYVSNSYATSQFPAFTQRSGGELVAVFNEFGDGNYFTQSVDGGETWSVPLAISPESYGRQLLIETEDGRLLMLGPCDFGGVCIYESSNGAVWSELDLSRTTDFSRCNIQDCFLNNVTGGSLIQNIAGDYVVSYSRSINDNRDVYVTSSADMASWSEPVRVSSAEGADFDSMILQLSDGTYYLTHVAYSPDRIVVLRSLDLLNWEEAASISRNTNLSMRPELLEISGKPVLFFTTYDIMYYSYLNDAGQFTSPAAVTNELPFGPDVHLLKSGKLGLMYPKDLNNQRDIFYEEINAVPLGE